MNRAGLRSTVDPSRDSLAARLRALCDQLDGRAHPEPLRSLFDGCTEELEASLEAAPGRAPEAAPDLRAGASRELAWLSERLLGAEAADVVGILRRIRRILGRLDAAGIGAAGIGAPTAGAATADADADAEGYGAGSIARIRSISSGRFPSMT